MLNTERLCLGCMNDNGGEKVCPICGYDSSIPNPENCLPAKFVINNRYLVGKTTAVDGEGITYIGWDNGSDNIVKIKEYFPIGFAHRNPDKTVSMVEGGEYTFNEGLLEFNEINRTIMGSELPALIPVTDIFEENGTIYSVMKNIPGITLEQFLEKNGGTLKWEQARALLLPLIDTVSGMNEKGIIHRGISTQTILVGRDGTLRIADYSIKKLRMESSELETCLYSGYAAAEQYNIADMHDDTYTDVYGFAATLFRVLIGNDPPNALARLDNGAMAIPAKFAEELPRHVLAALANGLQPLPQKRTKNMEIFKNELVYGEIAEPVPAKAKSQAPEKEDKKGKKEKSSSAKYAVISAICTASVFLIVAVVLLFTVFREDVFGKGDSSSSSQQASVEAPVVDQIGDVESGAEVTAKLYSVPDLKGKYYAEIIEEDQYEMFEFVIVDKSFSSQYPKGTVCAQSVAPNNAVERDTKIELTISLGNSEVKIANVIGQSETDAKLELLKQGFLYDNIIVKEKYDADREPATIVDQEPEYGTSVSTEVKVIIYINSYEGEESLPEDTSSEE